MCLLSKSPIAKTVGPVCSAQSLHAELNFASRKLHCPGFLVSWFLGAFSQWEVLAQDWRGQEGLNQGTSFSVLTVAIESAPWLLLLLDNLPSLVLAMGSIFHQILGCGDIMSVFPGLRVGATSYCC